MEDLSYECFSVENSNVLNSLLNIKKKNIVKPIQNVMLISKIGETEKKIDKLLINRIKAIELFHWGKITTDGEISVIGSNQSESDPVAVIASDF